MADGFALEDARQTGNRSLARPLCFERTDVLFEASEFAQNYNLELDRVRSGMLDGRTVHFHVQFVEPELLAKHPEASAPSQETGVPAFSAEKLIKSIVAKSPAIACAMIRTSNGNSYQVYASRVDQTSFVERVRSALAELHRIGLDWLPELAIGAFICTRCELGLVPYTATLDGQLAIEVSAISVVDASARTLADMWLQAEAWCGGQSEDLTDAARLFASEVFSLLMVAEYRHRAGHPNALMQSLDARERILADFPLTRHLINFWDRRWNRQVFLSGSVFDYASDLRGLYEDWRA